MKNTIILLSMVCLASLTGCSEPNSNPANQPPDSSPANSGKSVPLTTEFSPPTKEGTPPPPIRLPRLAPAAQSPPTLMVPEGTVLLSKGKSVTSSDDFIIVGDLSYITDGVKEGGQGYYVELADGLQWVQMDLEKESSLAAIWVWHTNGWPLAFHDVIVQISNDPSFKSGVTTLFNNDYDNSATFGKGKDRPYIETHFGNLIDAKSRNARYVRLYSAGSTNSDQNIYIEVEVFGTPSS